MKAGLGWGGVTASLYTGGELHKDSLAFLPSESLDSVDYTVRPCSIQTDWAGIVTHAFNLSAQEEAAGGFL